jgi:hypothetical protein
MVVIAILMLSRNLTGKTNDLLSGNKMRLRRKTTIPVLSEKFNIYGTTIKSEGPRG